MKLLKLIITISLLSSSITYASCESGHWLKSKTFDGSIVILEDGSVWEISLLDKLNTTLWIPMDDIIVCNRKLINTDDNTAVGAKRIK